MYWCITTICLIVSIKYVSVSQNMIPQRPRELKAKLPLSLFVCFSVFLSFFFVSLCQDDAPGVLHGSPLSVSADPRVAMVPGVARHRHLLPGFRGLQVPARLHEDSWKRPSVSIQPAPHLRGSLLSTTIKNRGSVTQCCAELPGLSTASLSLPPEYLLEIRAAIFTS